MIANHAPTKYFGGGKLPKMNGNIIIDKKKTMKFTK